MIDPGPGQPDLMDAIRPTDPVELPPKPDVLCRSCGSLLHETLVSQGVDRHPNCEGNMGLTIAQPSGPPPGTEHPMRTELIRIIRWKDSSSARSRQMAIGPSEIGGSCDRRLAMRMAGIKPVNRTSDPWPAIVGTAMHDWLERAIGKENKEWLKAGRDAPWLTEKRVAADPLIVGTSDLYHIPSATVVDWKSMGDTARRKLEKEGPSESYKTQIQTYGLGYCRAGFQVKKVALMFLPRAGYLKDAQYYEWDFDPSIAQAAIERVYRVAKCTHSMMQANPGQDMWSQVPANRSELCGWCPFFLRGITTATAAGCGGN